MIQLKALVGIARAADSNHAASRYRLADSAGEIERLVLQSRAWEAAGRHLLGRLPPCPAGHVLDAGCGPMGWLGILADWVGPKGQVVGTDIDRRMLEAARRYALQSRLRNVCLVHDDLFESRLEPGSFDHVHARYQIAPLGRAEEQITAYIRLLKPSGWLVLEESDSASWRFTPPAPAAEELMVLVRKAFLAGDGDLDAIRRLPGLMKAAGIEAEIDAQVLALPPGLPYGRVVLQLADGLEERLQLLVDRRRLRQLRRGAEKELANPSRWGTTWVLIQVYGRPISGAIQERNKSQGGMKSDES